MFKRILAATLALLFVAPAVAADQPVVTTLQHMDASRSRFCPAAD